MAEKEKIEVEGSSCTYGGGGYCDKECGLRVQMEDQALHGGHSITGLGNGPVWQRVAWETFTRDTLGIGRQQCGRFEELNEALERVTRAKEEAGEFE